MENPSDIPSSQPTSFTAHHSEENLEEEAQRALKERLKISIRLRIALSFMVLFVLLCGMGISTLLLVNHLQKKQQFLEKTNNYAFEIQQARRYEKNYFLYGTNLYDAHVNVLEAHNLLRINKEELIAVVGDSAFSDMEESLGHYETLLTHFINYNRSANNYDSTDVSVLEGQLRQYGAEIIANALATIDKERIKMHKLISHAKITIIISLVFFLILIAYIINILTRQIIMPINRTVSYTQRIAEGDFSPIRPARKFRDEFSTLAMAINKMVHELRTRQEQLIQSRKMAAIGNLTAGVAHELNNPLNNISLSTETLLEDFDEYSAEEKTNLLNDISEQVERASSIVRNLLDFTRVSKPSFSIVPIADVIKTTVKLLANEIALNDISINVNIKQNLPPVHGNLRDLQQVFLNLLLNSIQAMPDGGRITINADISEDRYIKIDLSDTGTGIPPEHIDQIFEPFFSTKEVGKGTGLGLSVSYGIIENHKGKISVKSQIGKGTTFMVSIPVNE